MYFRHFHIFRCLLFSSDLIVTVDWDKDIKRILQTNILETTNMIPFKEFGTSQNNENLLK